MRVEPDHHPSISQGPRLTHLLASADIKNEVGCHLRLRSMLSVLANAVLMTIRAVPRPTRPRKAMKMSEVEKFDQVSMVVV